MYEVVEYYYALSIKVVITFIQFYNFLISILEAHVRYADNQAWERHTTGVDFLRPRKEAAIFLPLIIIMSAVLVEMIRPIPYLLTIECFLESHSRIPDIYCCRKVVNINVIYFYEVIFTFNFSFNVRCEIESKKKKRF